MKAKKYTPSIAVILIIIALIFPGIKLVKYILNSQSSVVAQNDKSAGYTKTAKPASNHHWSLSDYQVIVRNDLFKPLGILQTVPVVATSLPKQIVQTEKQQPPPEPIYKLVFTGVVQLGSEYSALIEDSSKNKAYYLKKGERLKDYTIEAITDDNLILSNGNSKITIRMGSAAYYNSSGQITTSVSQNNQIVAKPPEKKAEETVSLNNSSASGSGNLSLIEQMKARRQKELEQK